MLFNQVDQFVNYNDLIHKNEIIIIGLSGGPDSIFLLHYLAAMHQKKELTLIAAHLDHQWRKNSFKDVEFCQSITEKLKIPLELKKMSDMPSMAIEGSQEEYGRKMRRLFLESIAKKYDAGAIALAHHLQDQEETFLIRLIRGTSLTGLTAMQAKRGLYIRPLLEINKNEIVAYLNTNAISYITDPSNELPTFLRNRIRNTVLPPLRACDKRFDHNFLSTLHRLQEADDYLTEITLKTFITISKPENKQTAINLNKFFSLPPFLQKRILMHFLIHENVPFTPTEKFLDEILRFLQYGDAKEHQIHEQWKIVKKNNLFFIKKRA